MPAQTLPGRTPNYPVSVSVIMPIYNAEATLRRAIRSVQKQSFSDWELVLIDDGSTDRSGCLCTEMQNDDPRLRLFAKGQNTGAAAARNCGMAAAQGRYIAFLDADDEWLPDKLARQIAFMRAGGHAFSYTGFWKVKSGRRVRMSVPRDVNRRSLLRSNIIGCLTAVYDRAFFGIVTMPDLKLRHDFALWLDLLTRTERATGLQEPLAIHHRRPGSLSASNSKATLAIWTLYRHHLRFSRVDSAYYLMRQIAQRLWRG